MSTKKSENVAFRVQPEGKRVLELIAESNRRERIGEVARLLLERGLTLYLKDELLFEPGYTVRLEDMETLRKIEALIKHKQLTDTKRGAVK